MMYKAFAAITLVAAPMLVLVVQSVAPQPATPGPAVSAVTQPIQPVLQPAPVAGPSSMVAAPIVDPASFAQPLPEAGKPMLTLGNGLPERQSPPPSAGEGAEDVAPVGEVAN